MRLKWHRLLVNPRTSVESVDGDVTRLRVDGLVCDSVCAVRTKQALHRIEGVQRVEVDYDAGTATIVGTPHAPEVYEHAVTGAVAGKPLRRLVEHAAHAFRRGDGPPTKGPRA